MRGLLCLSLTLVAATAMHTATQASMAAHSSVHGALKTVVTALVPLFLALVPTIFLLNTTAAQQGTECAADAKEAVVPTDRDRVARDAPEDTSEQSESLPPPPHNSEEPKRQEKQQAPPSKSKEEESEERLLAALGYVEDEIDEPLLSEDEINAFRQRHSESLKSGESPSVRYKDRAGSAPLSEIVRSWQNGESSSPTVVCANDFGGSNRSDGLPPLATLPPAAKQHQAAVKHEQQKERARKKGGAGAGRRKGQKARAA